MALDPQYEKLAEVVASFTTLEASVEAAFTANKAAMADLQAKVDALTAQIANQSPPSQDLADGVAAVGDAVTQLQALQDKLQAAIPQNVSGS